MMFHMRRRGKPNKEITLVCIDGAYGWPSLNAMHFCKKQFNFAAAKFLTPLPEILAYASPLERQGIEVTKIEPLPSINHYSFFCIKRLVDYINTDYLLLVQHDGFILDSGLWTNDFFNYDYIGAAWADKRVGNGGFSLRSKKLLTALADSRVRDVRIEDNAIGRHYKTLLERYYGIKIAPLFMADRFSHEIDVHPSFGFHGCHHIAAYRERMISQFGTLNNMVLR